MWGFLADINFQANYIDLCREILPTFPVAYVGFSLIYGRRFFDVPGVNFNLLQQTLVGPVGNKFLDAAHAAARNVYVWTVNKEEWMEWSIDNHVDGVITDDPKLFLEVCNRASDEGAKSRGDITPRRKRTLRRRLALAWEALYVQVTTVILTVFFWRRLANMGKKQAVQAP
jgi:phosphatidylglycerol phospholipase C